ncbi:MAG: response regulator, partial [Deltaproteobacteria bacterium]|nr:response regulator [Deltaproteobacteria bacterium]
AQLGYDAQEFLGNPELWINKIHPEDAPRIVENLSSLFEKGHHAHEYRFQHKDGTYRWMRDELKLVCDKDGKPAEIIGYWVDITRQRQLEEELQRAQKLEAIGTLAGGIAHDFNNLLTTIQGTASLMLFDVDSKDPHYELLQMITKQVRRGAGLTAQLLGYASKGRYEVKPISLNRVVEETSDTFGRTHKEITIHQELTEDLSSIEADQSQIEQFLLNLYINASGAMPRGGTLTLKTMNVTHNDIKDIVHNPRSGSYVLLTVTDTGTGMDKETQERIFEPFFTTKEMGRGTGLGLASAYGIIKGHRGYIHVGSEKGSGTTFSIYLPASDKKVVTAIKPAEHVIEGSGTILLVDDEDPVLDIGVMMLEKVGYTVLEAKGGREAVEIYKANKDKIDLVILDMIMPDVGGGEAYDRMKEINPDVKVLLSSGYSIEGEATEILDRGCDGFIQKPFNIKELSGKIREFLDTG